MNRSYILFVIILISIIALQTMYTNSMYNNFVDNELYNIENKLYNAIDLEFHSRKFPDKKKAKYEIQLIRHPNLPQKTKDSLAQLAKVNSVNKYDIKKLLKEKIIRSEMELLQQRSQDMLFNDGLLVDINTLDSLFSELTNKNYRYRITNINSEGVILSSSSDDEKKSYDYTLDSKPIGMSRQQNIKLEIDIPLNYFMKVSITAVIGSILIIMMALYSLFYLLTILRKKDRNLIARESSINGVIHDIKTPISNAVLTLDMIDSGTTDPEIKDIIKLNNISLRYLMNKVESLLAASKGKNQKLIPSRQIVDISKINDRTGDIGLVLKRSFSHKAATINIKNNLESDVNIDLMFLESILANLIENSLRYSREKVIVNVDIYTKDNNLYLDVEDNGIGIDRKNFKSIFEQYFRIDVDFSKGTGIGLNNSRILARSHGGDLILVSSRLGVGSLFRATLK